MGVLHTDNLWGRLLTEGDRSFVTGVWNDERVAPTIGGLRTEQR